MKMPDLAAEEDITEQPILELSATTQLSDYVSAIAWSPTGNTLAAACCNGEVHLIQRFVGRALCPPTGNSIDALAFSFDGKWLAAGGLDGNITLWRIDSRSERLRQREIPELFDIIESNSWIYRLVWSPTSNHLAFNLGKTVQIWDADRAEVVTNLPGAATPQDLRWSPDGDHLAVATKNDIHIWNSHNWDARLYQWELNLPASTLAWSPDGSYLACAIHDHRPRSACFALSLYVAASRIVLLDRHFWIDLSSDRSSISISRSMATRSGWLADRTSSHLVRASSHRLAVGDLTPTFLIIPYLIYLTLLSDCIDYRPRTVS